MAQGRQVAAAPLATRQPRWRGVLWERRQPRWRWRDAQQAGRGCASRHKRPRTSTLHCIHTEANKQVYASPMPKRAHALRIGRFSEVARAYLVTTVTEARAPLFTDFRLARLTIRALQASDTSGTCRTLAFVLMPDHLHWLVELRAASLSTVVGNFKAKASAAINRETASPGVQRWQKGFHDHAVRREEDLTEIARYVVANPVRAGLARGAGAYPHWDAVWV